MSHLDKTFCASPNCVGDCGRKMSESLRLRLDAQKVKPISYGYFCGEPELTPLDTNEDLMPRDTMN